ncbi:hypothetical protein ACFSJU_01500 [Paradesertivirga mongoliensis]|uniref:Uncharacterized protein n=1 Tax=Paradesertivirga mongoliensis TaxID=2100740 RepID=A0ABW4ZGQ1_9SPHI|nr:hypothetical protein [Pedobacter mongoliensis]
MENLSVFTVSAKFKLSTVISVMFLMFLSLNGIAQNNPGQGTDRPSHAEQSSEYLQSIEADPNGVPNSSEWYVQPWIWAIVAAILVLVIGLLFTTYGKRDVDSERGL